MTDQKRVYLPSRETFGTVVSTRRIMGITGLIVQEDGANGRRLFYVGTNDDLVFVDTGKTRLGVTYDGVIPPDE
ncbi:FirrV-1-J2 [Feldmannia irregularis virus a]|uniref:FirrV-1-J2 n=1 Tax=Feldmannia irregularis virus a TaxID=231992 RepID=Q6XLT9_9PHYC|nr:FirrV-1-J2 [Feldmannia irregularis virus a]AAR26972.1 FirrV-1-J2 [Feldmannia irregularis virus a]